MLGERLRSLRKEKNLTQQDLAERFGLAKSTISQYENEVNEPDNETLEKFADFFNVSIDYLLGRTNNSDQVLSRPTRELLDVIDLSDEEIMNKIPLSIDGRFLTIDEYKWFLAAIRAKRNME